MSLTHLKVEFNLLLAYIMKTLEYSHCHCHFLYYLHSSAAVLTSDIDVVSTGDGKKSYVNVVILVSPRSLVPAAAAEPKACTVGNSTAAEPATRICNTFPSAAFHPAQPPRQAARLKIYNHRSKDYLHNPRDERVTGLVPQEKACVTNSNTA